MKTFEKVQIIGTDPASLTEDEQDLLEVQAEICQAMCEKDIETLRRLYTEDATFRHMSGMVQTREAYFNDIAGGRLNYFNIGIENPVIHINGNDGEITYTSILDARAYGAKGVFHMKGTHHFQKNNGQWKHQ